MHVLVHDAPTLDRNQPEARGAVLDVVLVVVVVVLVVVVVMVVVIVVLVVVVGSVSGHPNVKQQHMREAPCEDDAHVLAKEILVSSSVPLKTEGENSAFVKLEVV